MSRRGLVVFTPLRIEAMALRKLSPVISGMGGKRASTAVQRYRSSHPLTHLAVGGVAGSLDPHLSPGAVVVADRVIDSSGREIGDFPLAQAVVGMLKRAGIDATAGTTVTVGKLVTDDLERKRLAEELGALAVDMETFDILQASGGVPAVVIRAISDAPGSKLFSPSALGGIRAGLRSLSRCAPTIATVGSLLDPGHSSPSTPPPDSLSNLSNKEAP